MVEINHHRVIVVSDTVERGTDPSFTSIDIRGIAEYLLQGVEKGCIFVPVFVGCGCSKHEAAVCKELVQMGVSLHNEIFMDKLITSAAISHIQSYFHK